MATFTADQLPEADQRELAAFHAGIEAQSPARPQRDWRTDAIAAYTERLAEAERWNAFASRLNAHAVGTGLTDAETVAQWDATAAEEMDHLRRRLAELTAESAAA